MDLEDMREEVVSVNFGSTFIATVQNAKKPYKLEVEMPIEVMTTKRVIRFVVPYGYSWNGADVPRFFWRIIGSPTESDFLKASMLHDFMLEFKVYIFNEVLCNTLNVDEYRQLTSDIFEQVLIDEHVSKFKAKVMASAVQFYQSTFNKKAWAILEGKK